MPRYKPSDCHALLLPVVLSEQIGPGTRPTLPGRSDCAACALRGQCLKKRRSKVDEKKGAKDERGRQVARFFPSPADFRHPSERMRQAIDSPRGRQL